VVGPFSATVKSLWRRSHLAIY